MAVGAPIEKVAELLREVAAQAVMPRFQRLAEAEVRVKSPGEEVTIADEEAERLLTAGLSALLPGSRVIGEEAVSAQPELLQGLGEGTVFVVDPVDGTANFIKGSPCFSMMVALLREGEAIASWMLSPATGALHVAERGSGAWVDGERVRVGQPPHWTGLRGGVLTRFLPAETTARVQANGRDLAAILPGMHCAGEEYPAIVRGEQNFVVFWRGLPWDHAPGTLFLEEAGGRAARFDGSRYRPAEQGFGILAAQSPELWDELQRRLFAEP